MKDEWFVYQGNRNYPKEWANFVLSKQGAKETSAKPDFSNAAKFDTNKVMGDRRVRLTLTAPKSSISDKAVSRYEIRTQLGEVEVNEATWANMQTFENAYQPAQPGTPQTLDVIGLAPGQTYTIALQAFDELEQPSGKMLSTTVTLENKGTDPFVTVSPTGRSLVFTDGTPFTVVGETGLMPWLPLRGLYDGDLCDEDWSEKDNYDCGKDEKGQFIGKTRNYSKEKYFGCSDENGKVLHSILIIQQEGKDWNQLQTDCDHKGYPVVQQEGPEVAEEYFGKLKDAGVNVLTVFVESLDLKATPIFFEPSQGQYNKAALQFLKRLVDLARKYDVYLIIRLYDTFYYRKNIDTIDKWSRTYWATELHKSSPEDFFHKDLDDSHKARMKVLFDLYKQEPHILGWDLLNEVDNKARFNQANFADRKKWLEEMLVYAKGQNPFQLMFYSFLTWDPKDSDYYRADIDDVIGKEKVIDEITGKEKEVEVKMTEEDYLGMDAELAYRVPKADLAVPHGYYAHIAAPGRDATTNPDYEKPLELARGISYGFHQIRDGRPILDGEGGPSPLFIKTYEEDDRFTSEQDKDMFLNSLWLHFVSGGAGANLRWPHDMKKSATINQIPSDWRELSKVFKDTVGDIPWRGHHLKISHRERSDGIRVMTRYDGRRAVSYFYNPQKHVISTITLPELDNAWVNVKIVNPRTGEELLSQDDNTTSSFNIEGFADHLVVVVERQVAALEATNSVWSKSTNHYLDLWPKFVFPFVEEDVYFWLEDSDKKRQYITLSNDLPVLNSTRQPMYRRVTWTATFYGDLSEYRTRSFKDNDGKSITPILHIPMSGLPAGSYQVGTEIGGHVSFTKFEIED
ncbi:MAG: hypothetical protein B6242_13675 [Anaerolineaceae bacterium 4572_78]|nr:MAG: hypothetical protein B6242_13675 [Anaerolineaceae bacterium 4572_78]